MEPPWGTVDLSQSLWEMMGELYIEMLKNNRISAIYRLVRKVIEALVGWLR